METYPSSATLCPDTSTISPPQAVSTLGLPPSVLECSTAPRPPEPILARSCSSGTSIGASSAREKRSDSRTMVQSTLSTSGGKDSMKLNFFDPGIPFGVSRSFRHHDGMKASSLDIGMDPRMVSDCIYLATM